MTQKRRLPSSIHPSKKPRSFLGWIVLFILCVGAISGIGGYYFLKGKTASTSLSLKQAPTILEETVDLRVPKTSEENEEDLALIDDLYQDSESVQLYRAQESASKDYNYWRYPINNQTIKGGSVCALFLRDVNSLDKKALSHIHHPLTMRSSLDLSRNNKRWSFVYPIKITEGLSFEALGKEIDRQIESEFCMGVLLTETYSPQTLEFLLIHLKQRGLILIDGSTMPQKTLNDISYKTLALAIKLETTLKQDKIKGKKLMGVSLKDLLSAKGKRWVQFQKKHGVRFVSLDQLF